MENIIYLFLICFLLFFCILIVSFDSIIEGSISFDSTDSAIGVSISFGSSGNDSAIGVSISFGSFDNDSAIGVSISFDSSGNDSAIGVSISFDIIILFSSLLFFYIKV